MTDPRMPTYTRAYALAPYPIDPGHRGVDTSVEAAIAVKPPAQAVHRLDRKKITPSHKKEGHIMKLDTKYLDKKRIDYVVTADGFITVGGYLYLQDTQQST